MSTALLSMYDFVDYRNTSNSAQTDLKSKTPTPAQILQSSLFQTTTTSSSLSSSHSHQSHSQSQSHPLSNHSLAPGSKMTGPIRRTVSSAATPTSGSASLSSNLILGNSSIAINQQQHQRLISKPSSAALSTRLLSGLNKDPHKKLDRSFSEPAEKKSSSSSSSSTSSSGGGAAAASGSATSLGPSSRYKTELCRSFAEVGSCKYGDKCQFAHGDEELRTVTRHPKFKTENCKSFHSTGFCPYGPRCHFIHNVGEEPAKRASGNPTSPAPSSTQQNQPGRFEPVVAGTSGAPTSSNLVRPKALSLGSYSLGSSGEISLPSSQSGSPTSLNSFFTEENGGGHLNNSFLHSSFLNGPPATQQPTRPAPGLPHPASSHHYPASASHLQHGSTFSFSPDSAFTSFSQSSNSSASSSLSFGSQNGPKNIFGGSQPSGLNHRGYSPEPLFQGSSNHPEAQVCDETTSSVIFSLFGNGFGESNSGSIQNGFGDLYSHHHHHRALSPIGSQKQSTCYPVAPESPVDSVASEIEALKLGESLLSGTSGSKMVGFAPISPLSFSSTTSGCSSLSNQSPSNGLMSELEALGFGSNGGGGSGASTNGIIPRLPTFAKFSASLDN